jgi:hypothetical protein
LRASVRRHRSRLSRVYFGRSDRSVPPPILGISAVQVSRPEARAICRCCSNAAVLPSAYSPSTTFACASMAARSAWTQSKKFLNPSRGMSPGGMMMSSFVARLRLGKELAIAHLRSRLAERPDQQCALTPPRHPSEAPPSVSTDPWVRVRPSAWGFGPMNGG